MDIGNVFKNSGLGNVKMRFSTCTTLIIAVLMVLTAITGCSVEIKSVPQTSPEIEIIKEMEAPVPAEKEINISEPKPVEEEEIGESDNILNWSSETRDLKFTIKSIEMVDDGSGANVTMMKVNVHNSGRDEITPEFKLAISDDLDYSFTKYFKNVVSATIYEGGDADFDLMVNTKMPRSEMEKKITVYAYDENDSPSKGISIMRLLIPSEFMRENDVQD